MLVITRTTCSSSDANSWHVIMPASWNIQTMVRMWSRQTMSMVKARPVPMPPLPSQTLTPSLRRNGLPTTIVVPQQTTCVQLLSPTWYRTTLRTTPSSSSSTAVAAKITTTPVTSSNWRRVWMVSQDSTRTQCRRWPDFTTDHKSKWSILVRLRVPSATFRSLYAHSLRPFSPSTSECLLTPGMSLLDHFSFFRWCTLLR